MATDKTPSPEATILAKRFKRELEAASRRAYRRALREYAKDADCTEDEAKAWLAAVGIAEPK